MAFLLNQQTGTASGKLGNVVYRAKKNGVSIIAPAPRKYKKTNKVGAIKNRSKFSMVVKFASAVNSSDLLKNVWRSVSLPGKSSYTRIYKSNYSHSSSDYILSSADFVPNNFNAGILSVFLDDSNLEINYTLFDKLNSDLIPPFHAVAFLHLYSPIVVNANHPYNRFLIVEQKLDSLNLAARESLSFKFNTVENAYEIIKDYNIVTVYFTIIFNYEENKLGWLHTLGYIHKGVDVHNKLIEKHIENSKTKLSKNNPVKDSSITVKLR